MKIIIYTVLAILAFSGNSVLCRIALDEELIDAASFTWIRLLSGIVVLLLLINATRFLNKNNKTSISRPISKGSWKAAFMLFVYALTFSIAYISLDTGIGALILFSSVQITMIFISLLRGNTLQKSEWFGMGIAFSGLVYLLLPNLNTPSMLGFVLMFISGGAWGLYTSYGKGSSNPLDDTAYNFLRTLPFVIALIVITLHSANVSSQGIILAILSGGIASGLGYAIWYMALDGLSITQAAVVQLLVPIVAAISGTLFAQDDFSLRLVISSMIILSGILLVIIGRYRTIRLHESKV